MKVNLEKMLSHPLFLLIVTAVLGSLLIPWINASIDSAKDRKQLRKEIVMSFLDKNAQIKSYLNSMKTAVGNFSKDSSPDTMRIKTGLVERLNAELDHLDKFAWWAYEPLIERTKQFSLLTTTQAAGAYDRIKKYDSIIITVKDTCWSIHNSGERSGIETARRVWPTIEVLINAAFHHMDALIYEICNEIANQ